LRDTIEKNVATFSNGQKQYLCMQNLICEI